MVGDKGEMGGCDNLLRPDGPPVRPHQPRRPLQRPGALINRQVPDQGGEKFQRMKLPLPGKTDRPRRGKGQRQIRCKPGGDADFFQGFQLPVQRRPPGCGVDEVVLLLEAAVDLPAQRPVPRQRRLLRLPVQPRPLRAEFLQKPAVDESVLGGDLRRGASGGPPAEAVRLHQQAVRSRLPEHPGAQNARDPAADDQHVRFSVALQGRELRQRRRFGPDGFHIAHLPFLPG